MPNQKLEIWNVKDGDFYGIELRLKDYWTLTNYFSIMPYCHSWQTWTNEMPKTVYRQETLGM